MYLHVRPDDEWHMCPDLLFNSLQVQLLILQDFYIIENSPSRLIICVYTVGSADIKLANETSI